MITSLDSSVAATILRASSNILSLPEIWLNNLVKNWTATVLDHSKPPQDDLIPSQTYLPTFDPRQCLPYVTHSNLPGPQQLSLSSYFPHSSTLQSIISFFHHTSYTCQYIHISVLHHPCLLHSLHISIPLPHQHVVTCSIITV